MTNDPANSSGVDLQERFDGFGNGYRMNCNCGRATNLSAAMYVEREDD